MTLKEKCTELQIKDSYVSEYMHRHKCTVEQAIVYYRPDLRLDLHGKLIGYEHFYIGSKTIKQKCEELGTSYKGYLDFLARHKISHNDSIIRLYDKQSKIRSKVNKLPSIKSICGDTLTQAKLQNYVEIIEILCINNIKFENLDRYKKNNHIENYDIAIRKYIDYLNKKEDNNVLKNMIETSGVTDGNFYYYRNLDKYIDKSDREIIDMIKNKESLSNFCKIHNLNYYKALEIKKKNPDCNYNEILKILSTYKRKPSTNYEGSFKEKCNSSNIDYNSARAFRQKHRNLTDEQIVNYYLNLKAFKKLCEDAHVSYKKALNYKSKYSKSDEETIIHFNANCYINCLGELVIPT